MRHIESMKEIIIGIAPKVIKKTHGEKNAERILNLISSNNFLIYALFQSYFQVYKRVYRQIS